MIFVVVASFESDGSFFVVFGGASGDPDGGFMMRSLSGSEGAFVMRSSSAGAGEQSRFCGSGFGGAVPAEDAVDSRLGVGVWLGQGEEDELSARGPRGMGAEVGITVGFTMR
jgi:hypothetical protein